MALSRKQGALLAGGAAAIAGLTGVVLLTRREQRLDGPDYMVVEQHGAFELRAYPELLVAETHDYGTRDDATGSGFKRLYDYIADKDRAHGPVEMTTPVIVDHARTRWRTRFVMPGDRTPSTLPATSPGVTLATVPARRLVAYGFSGRMTEAAMARREEELADWLTARGYKADGTEWAFYNSPMIPPPLRRNEVWAVLGD